MLFITHKRARLSCLTTSRATILYRLKYFRTRKETIISSLLWGSIAAVAYVITVIFFVRGGQFEDAWWLYTGNVLFGIAIGVFTLRQVFEKRRGGSTGSMSKVAHGVTVAGIIVSCVLSFIVISLFMPGVLTEGQPGTVLQQAPSQTQDGKFNGMVMMIYLNAIVGNVATGSFSALILPYTAKFNQTRDKEPNILKDEPGDKSVYPGQGG